MALEDLPTELILKILSNLRTGTIERLAKTYNKRLVAICQPFLKYRIAQRRNAKRMIALIPPRLDWIGGDDCLNGNIQKLWSHFQLENEWGPISPAPRTEQKPFHSLEFLNLRGRYTWMLDLEWLDEENLSPFEHYRARMTEEQIARLKDQAEKLGLEFPKGFFDFMETVEEDWHVSMSGACSHFHIPESSLMKVKYYLSDPPSRAKEQSGEGNDGEEVEQEPQHLVEGYVLQVHEDQQGCGCWSLFLDAGPRDDNGKIIGPPGHCVLGGPCRPYYGPHNNYNKEFENDLTPLERELGIQMTSNDPDDWTLEAPSFEEWAVQMYFESLSVLFDPKKESKLPNKLKLWLLGVYNEKAREVYSRWK